MAPLNLRHLSPHDARTVLRKRLAAQLPEPSPWRHSNEGARLRDEDLLALLLGVQIVRTTRPATFRDAYEMAASGQPGARTIDDLIEAGFLAFRLDQVVISRMAREEIRADATPGLAPLKELLDRVYDRTYIFGAAVLADATLASHAEGLANGSIRWSDLTSSRPQWVAARIWEEARAHASVTERLYYWMDRWALLEWPELVMEHDWEASDAADLRQACRTVLSNEIAANPWTDERRRIVNLLERRMGTAADARVPPLPLTESGKLSWLDDRLLENSEVFHWDGPYREVVWLLLCDLAETDLVRGDLASVAALLEDIPESPFALLGMIAAVHRKPALLADLLLSPKTAPLAIALISGWFGRAMLESHGGQALLASSRRNQNEALDDGLVALTRLMAGTPPRDAEVAAVLIRLQTAMLAAPDGADADHRRLRDHYASWPQPRLLGVLDDVLAQPSDGYFEDPALFVALGLLEDPALRSSHRAHAVVDRYVAGIAPSSNRAGVIGFTPQLCRLLDQLSRQDLQARANFLKPFDSLTLIKQAAPDDRIGVSWKAASSLRAHIRILSRAVLAAEGQPSKDLLDALIEAIWAGAVENLGRGRTNAFSPRFERGPIASHRAEPPLASDLARTLGRLAPSDQTRLTDALAETDEPFILAQLASLTSGDVRSSVLRRLAGLTPDRASDAVMITDEPARIEAMLEVGMVSEAEQHLDGYAARVEGRRTDRDLDIFRMRAQILAAKLDLTGLASLPAPEGLLRHQEEEAHRQRSFYRAVLLLRRNQSGDLQASQTIFRDLQRKQPHVLAYQQNAIAVEIALLTDGRPFNHLTGDALSSGLKLAQEADRLMTVMSDRPLATLAANLAWLRLLLGEPEKALQTLDSADAQTVVPQAVRIAALYDLGRRHEAEATLVQAERHWPKHDLIEAARQYLGGGSPHGNLAEVLALDDPIQAIRSALFSLRGLDPESQVKGWGFGSAEAFLSHHVRQAVTSLASLRSAMRKLALDTKEDDISRVLQAIVRGRLDPLGWTIGDQSLGGYTAAGNPGERDLVISHSAVEVSVIEAVVCRKPMTHVSQVGDLRYHFKKLFGYTRARVMFHVTFSRIADQTSILTQLEEIAKTDAPNGFNFRSIEPLPVTGDAAQGRLARFEDQWGLVTVVFMVVDFDQSVQKAATPAHSPSTRNKPKTGTTAAKKRTSRQPKIKGQG